MAKIVFTSNTIIDKIKSSKNQMQGLTNRMDKTSKKDILMVVHTEGTLEPSDNDRFTYLAKILVENGNSVEMITSDFEHHKKRYRNKSVAKEWPFLITFLHEDSYSKNVSFRRIFAHLSFARRLKKYLKRRKKPDVIYLAIPPTTSAYVCACFAKKQNIRLVEDLQDLWPETFFIALGNNFFSRLILQPVFFFANHTYAKANAVLAVSDTFKKRILEKAKNAEESATVYLGTDGLRVEKALENNILKKPKGEFWLCYEGHIGVSYDFYHVFSALELLEKQGINNIKFLILGDGDQRDNVEKMIKRYHPNTFISGYLPYEKMIQYLAISDLAINPIIKKSECTIPNKINDYAAVGIPVINTMRTAEFRKIVVDRNIGLNALCENAEDIARQIRILYEDDELRVQMGKNAKFFFDEKCDRRKTYHRMVEIISK